MVAKFIDELVKRDILDEYCRDEYVYAVTIRAEKIVTYSILFFIAILCDKFVSGMIYSLSFMLLRQTTGGFHAKSYAGCLIGTTLLFVISIEVFAPFLGKHSEMEGIFLLLSILCILRYAPVNHPNMGLSKSEQEAHRRKSWLTVLIEVFFICLSKILKIGCYQYISTGIITCAVFILLAKLIRQEV